MELKSIPYGNSKIDFVLKRNDRKTLGIKVYPDGSTVVIAPAETSYDKITEKVKSKAQWIDKQKDFFMLFEPRAKEKIYESGESHLYLGRNYRLKIREANTNSVKLKGGYIFISVKNKYDKILIEKELKKWYKSKAILHFQTLFDNRLGLAKEISDKETSLNYKWFNNRWGSCFKDGAISLNLELIKAPKECIDYVIVHEICHLVHHNHSAKFYTLLGKKLPKWRESKVKLEKLLS
jgi:predicted metal-dependent hydrolase